MKPNIFVGLCEGSSMYRRWYFEVVIDQHEASSHLPAMLRIGWANSNGFVPYPGGGEGWGCNGAGDDLFSFAFDGNSLWTGECIIHNIHYSAVRFAKQTRLSTSVAVNDC